MSEPVPKTARVTPKDWRPEVWKPYRATRRALPPWCGRFAHRPAAGWKDGPTKRIHWWCPLLAWWDCWRLNRGTDD